jgi:hypothetical protein
MAIVSWIEEVSLERVGNGGVRPHAPGMGRCGDMSLPCASMTWLAVCLSACDKMVLSTMGKDQAARQKPELKIDGRWSGDLRT